MYKAFIVTFLCLASLFCKAQASGDSIKPVTPQIEKNAICDKPDSRPEYPGGNQALGDYISNHLQYPVDAAKKEIQGVVVVEFVITPDGSTIDIKSISGPKELWRAAETLIRQAGRWKAGKLNGKKVSCRVRQPIVFKLSST